MDEQHGITLPDAVIIIQFLFGALMGMLIWSGKRQVARIDGIESRLVNAVDVAQYNATIDTFRRQMAESTQSTNDLLRATHERIDKLMLLLAEKKN